MGRTVGHGSRMIRDLARRRRARRLARTSASATAALVAEALRLRAEAEALVTRLGPALEEARHAVSEAEEWLRPAMGEARQAAMGRAAATEQRLGPAARGAREEARRRVAEAGRRLDPLLGDASRLAERAVRLAERAGRSRSTVDLAGPAPAAAESGMRPMSPAASTPAAALSGMPPMLHEAPGVVPPGPGLGPVVLGLAAAQACFAATFRGPRDRFWDRMTLTGLALGGYALVARPALRSTRIRPVHVALGAASAAVLYGTFAIGDRVARRAVPSGTRDIAEIYALRDLRPRSEIALRLVTIIGPAEELFWRGLVQAGLMARFGRWPGAALAAATYGGVHAVTGNFTLFGAAGVAGAHWCALYAAGVPLGALVVSHQLWDVWIFLLQPTSDVGGPANP